MSVYRQAFLCHFALITNKKGLTLKLLCVFLRSFCPIKTFYFTAANKRNDDNDDDDRL